MNPWNCLSDDQASALKEAWSTYYHRKQVNALDIGYKRVDGHYTDGLAVRIHVAEKFAMDILSKRERFPATIGGMPTDVLISRPGIPSHFLSNTGDRVAKHEYLHPGISVGKMSSTFFTGTLGLIVRDNKSGAPCILSAWHVLDGVDLEEPTPRTSQPSKKDDNNSEDNTIGEVLRGWRDNHIDAAITKLTYPKIQYQQHGTTDIVSTARMPRIGDEVRKSGRTTGVTEGRIDGIGWYSYRVGAITKPIFGFRVIPRDGENVELSASHDSGAVWYDIQTREGVGLHVAGEVYSSTENEYAIACLLPSVLEALDVTIMSG